MEGRQGMPPPLLEADEGTHPLGLMEPGHEQQGAAAQCRGHGSVDGEGAECPAQDSLGGGAILGRAGQLHSGLRQGAMSFWGPGGPCSAGTHQLPWRQTLPGPTLTSQPLCADRTVGSLAPRATVAGDGSCWDAVRAAVTLRLGGA